MGDLVTINEVEFVKKMEFRMEKLLIFLHSIRRHINVQNYKFDI